MDDRDFWIGVTAFTLFVSLFVGLGSFGAYKYGRMAERRELTKYFVQMTQDTYSDAYKDGFTAGKKFAQKEFEEEVHEGRY